jgi:hypothetical protein
MLMTGMPISGNISVEVERNTKGDANKIISAITK